ncbi:hypothetical protein Dda_4890 [Drechslerella dactyloides]|uniref:Cell wall protein PhiA n=1 Tax=Drechslerella dactyloides TaxID=74499 RepID=A0AAD6NL13_DREDA|nr:hypothetical protein Dda_4890 [Drechslerella dactyloides]
MHALKWPLIFTTFLAGAASALPTASTGADSLRRALCTPQDNTGFTVRINSTDDLNDKIVGIANGVVGVDLPNTESVIWPYTSGRELLMPGPGYKFVYHGYLYSTGDATDGQQLRFAREVPPATEAQADVFSTSCDIRGQFYLTSLADWNWQACQKQAGGWTIRRESGKGGCRAVRLKMTYGPPY